jgi:hypothetical protein
MSGHVTQFSCNQIAISIIQVSRALRNIGTENRFQIPIAAEVSCRKKWLFGLQQNKFELLAVARTGYEFKILKSWGHRKRGLKFKIRNLNFLFL